MNLYETLTKYHKQNFNIIENYTNKDIGVFVNKNNYMNLYETLTKYHKQNFNIIENNKYGKKKKKKRK
ncbi:hypothetical protein PFAG_03844 [Plasmodium falciparum Santa Lucia]|uniref:Uncharacterized protein n=1 Tax=Plasmodium falciparum Santa Lucia TaxID=478859 RepID=W7FV59_PLAFA|nr:hypothetical protein PFAG_03844 [Plasmodium falciparum Santa Lucia]